MDFPDANAGSPGGFDSGWDEPNEGLQKKKPLPPDLPTSLDDRRHVPTELVPETEMYDGWQGMSSSLFICLPMCYRLTLHPPQDKRSSSHPQCSPSPSPSTSSTS